MKRRVKLVGLTCALCAVVFSTGCPPGDSLRLIFDQSNFTNEGVISEMDGDQEMAGWFVLAAGLSTISRVEWWGSTDAPDAMPHRFRPHYLGSMIRLIELEDVYREVKRQINNGVSKISGKL